MSNPSQTIFVQRNTTDPFARVPKSALDDKRLSWKSKGILSYLLGKPVDWKAQVTDIMRHGTDGEEAVRTGLRELRLTGYAELSCKRVGGKVIEWILKVSDTPKFEPDPGNTDLASKPDPGKPDLENRPLTKKDCITKKDTLTIQAAAIYETYPRKVGRPKALVAIAKAIKAHGHELVAKAVQRFAAAWKGAPKEDMQFCPHPATWFNQERFNDAPETWARTGLDRNQAPRRNGRSADGFRVADGMGNSQ